MGLKVTNNAFGTLNASINSSATTIVLVAGQGARFPTLSAGDYFYATLIDTSNNLEIVKVTARSTDTLTVVRGQDNTTGRAYATNDRFELRPTAALFNEKADTADVTTLLAAKQDLSSELTTYAATGVGMRNRIINGQFDVWQRGTSFSVTGGVNLYNADRFMTEGYGHNYTASRQTFTAGQTDVPGYPTYYLRLASTTVVSAGQYFALVQRVETPEVVTGYGTYTLSFWVRASSGTVAASAFTYGINGASVSSPALTTTWQKLTVTATVATAGSYLTQYLLYFGVGKGNVSIDIANVQLEYGSVATVFEKKPYALEYEMCLRYYEVLDSNYSFALFVPNGGYLNKVAGTWTYQVKKRTTPSLSQFPGSTVGMDRFGIGPATISSVSLNTSNDTMMTFDITLSTNYSTGERMAFTGGKIYQATAEL
jgi:hypothetical protein